MSKLAVIFIGLASGTSVAAGVFALITSLGIVQRFAVKIRGAKNTYLFENAIIFGGIIFNIITLFDITIPFGYPYLIFSGLCIGIYIGALAMALAEVIKILPILTSRLKICEGIPFIILAMALGKAIFSCYILVSE